MYSVYSDLRASMEESFNVEVESVRGGGVSDEGAADGAIGKKRAFGTALDANILQSNINGTIPLHSTTVAGVLSTDKSGKVGATTSTTSSTSAVCAAGTGALCEESGVKKTRRLRSKAKPMVNGVELGGEENAGECVQS